MVIPLIRPSAEMGFWAYVGHIALKIFPILILPAIVAWTIRYTTHKLQRWLMRLSRYTFYIWGVGLTLAMVLATRALMLSGLPAAAIALVVAVSLAACALQFFIGRRIGRMCAGKDPAETETITVGQAMGQKNTGFLIWLGYNFMTPVTSVAGGLYAIWQNLFNSWELYRKGRSAQKEVKNS
jgi:BASS family bile acid:Na+ symporter